MFERRHYKFLATLLRRQPVKVTKDRLIRCIAIELAGDNPRFDKAKFIKACY